MYESPINVIRDQMIAEVKMDYEKNILKAVYNTGIYVDKEELLKALQYDRDQYEKGYDDGFNADKWIPCSERLPENTDNVNATIVVNGKTKTVTAYYGSGDWFVCHKDNNLFLATRHEIIAWQPLPEPYRPKGEHR